MNKSRSGWFLVAGLTLLMAVRAEPVMAADGAALPKDVLATVNGIAVMTAEFDLLVNQFKSMEPGRFEQMSKVDQTRFTVSIFNQLVQRRLLMQEAKRQKFHVSDALVENEYEVVKSGFPSEREFLAALERGKTNPAAWKQGARESLLQAKLEEAESRRRITVTDEEIARYWDEHHAVLRQDLVRARQILVRTEAESQQVVDALNGGLSFPKAARKYSRDVATREKDGDLGWIGRSEAFPAFEEAVFSLAPKAVSAPFQGKYGYHIVQLLEKKSAKTTDLADYRNRISNLLRHQKWPAERETWLRELQERATIRVNGPALFPDAPLPGHDSMVPGHTP